MMELIEQPPLTAVVPELVQLVLERVEIKKGNEFEFHFIDGAHQKVKL